MLRLIPRPAYRAGLRLAHALRKVWWRLARPSLAGCRVIACDAAGRVLLVRHSYGTGRWMLPGGGLGRDEDACEAATRELFEETGCRLTGAVLRAVIDEPLHGAVNRVHVVIGRTDDPAGADGREIVEAGFFHPGALPANCAKGLGSALIPYLKTGPAGGLSA